MSHTFKAGRKTYLVQGLKHWVCPNCETSLCSESQLTDNAAAIAAFEDKLPGYISPEQIIALREKYGITQEEAGKIFGGGRRAFSKYERGEVCPSASSAASLKRALSDPQYFSYLSSSRCAGASDNIGSDQSSTDTTGVRLLSISTELHDRLQEFAVKQKISTQAALERLVDSALAANQGSDSTIYARRLSNFKKKIHQDIVRHSESSHDYLSMQSLYLTPIQQSEVLLIKFASKASLAKRHTSKQAASSPSTRTPKHEEIKYVD